MKFLTAGILLLGILSVGLFGFMAMDHGTGHGAGCVAAMASGSVCPGKGTLVSFLFHSETLKIFSTAVPINNAAFFTFIILAFWFSRKILFNFVFIEKRDFWENRIFAVRKFIAWLSFHENSPAAA